MKKVIEGQCVNFYEDSDKPIMYIDHSIDECVWYFDTGDVITITEDMELFPLLEDFMSQKYVFSPSLLQDSKSEDKLVWYSDCSYNPDDKWSVNSVSCLNIERVNNTFRIWCFRPIDEIINKKHKFYCISFSPSGNGKSNKNVEKGTTLQDDFVLLVFQKLLDVKKLIKH